MRNTQAALVWITQILERFGIPYQIAGGLAANAYGVKRELADIDIDIPQKDFDKILNSVKETILFGPAHYKDEHWDLYMLTLCYQEQEIDITSADNIKIFNPLTGVWETLDTDFSKSTFKEVMGVWVPVIPKEDLLYYKRILKRPVDLLDIAGMEDTINSEA